MKKFSRLLIVWIIGSLCLYAFNSPQIGKSFFLNAKNSKAENVRKVEYQNYKFGDVLFSKETLFIPMKLKDKAPEFLAEFGHNDGVLYFFQKFPELNKRKKIIINNELKIYDIRKKEVFSSIKIPDYNSSYLYYDLMHFKSLLSLNDNELFLLSTNRIHYINIKNLYYPENEIELLTPDSIQTCMVDDGLVYCLSYYGTLHAFKNKKLYYSKNLGIRADGDILSFVKSGDDKFFYVLTGEKFYVVDKTWINREKVVGNIPVKNAVSMLVDEKRKSVYVSSQDHFYNISISNRKEPEIMYGLKFKDERLKGTYLLNFSGDKNYFYVLNKTDNTVYKVNIKSRTIVKSKKLFDKKTKKSVNYYSKGKIVYFKAFDKKPEVLFVVKKEATSLSLKGKNGDVYEIYEIVFP